MGAYNERWEEKAATYLSIRDKLVRNTGMGWNPRLYFNTRREPLTRYRALRGSRYLSPYTPEAGTRDGRVPAFYGARGPVDEAGGGGNECS
jgi:hypothetical protein